MPEWGNWWDRAFKRPNGTSYVVCEPCKVQPQAEGNKNAATNHPAPSESIEFEARIHELENKLNHAYTMIEALQSLAAAHETLQEQFTVMARTLTSKGFVLRSIDTERRPENERRFVISKIPKES
jgi:uncharacterized coiled-coil protein SlyX